MAEKSTSIVRILVKEEIQVIQVSAQSTFHTAHFTDDGTIYDYEGEPMVLQAALTVWMDQEGSELVNKFELSYDELVAKSGGWL